jgi:hypothetical protein
MVEQAACPRLKVERATFEISYIAVWRAAPVRDARRSATKAILSATAPQVKINA